MGTTRFWAVNFDTSLEGVFEVLDEITSTVAGKLAVQIDETRLNIAKRESIENIPAYDCCLRGMDCLRRGTLEGDEESRPYFQYAFQSCHKDSFAR